MASVDPRVNPAAFFEQERPRLFGIAYRMTGSATDAEDVLQEAFVAWRRAGAVENDAAYLTRIVVNRTQDLLRSAQRQRELYVGPWLPEPLVSDARTSADDVELAESVRLALLLVLDGLAPVERAVFILRDVFGYDGREVADLCGKSEAACRKALERARRRVRSGSKNIDPNVARSRAVLDAFVDAVRRQDLDAMVAALTDDVVLLSDGGGQVPAALRPVAGAVAVAKFVQGVARKLPVDARVQPVSVNDGPGFLVLVDERIETCLAADVDRSGRICAIHIVRSPKKLAHIRPRSRSVPGAAS